MFVAWWRSQSDSSGEACLGRAAVLALDTASPTTGAAASLQISRANSISDWPFSS